MRSRDKHTHRVSVHLHESVIALYHDVAEVTNVKGMTAKRLMEQVLFEFAKSTLEKAKAQQKLDI